MYIYDCHFSGCIGYNISLVPVKPPGVITGSRDCAAMLCIFMTVIFQAALDTVSPWYQGSRVSAMVPMIAAMLYLFMVVIFQAALDTVSPWYQGSRVSAMVPMTVQLCCVYLWLSFFRLRWTQCLPGTKGPECLQWFL